MLNKNGCSISPQQALTTTFILKSRSAYKIIYTLAESVLIRPKISRAVQTVQTAALQITHLPSSLSISCVKFSLKSKPLSHHFSHFTELQGHPVTDLGKTSAMGP